MEDCYVRIKMHNGSGAVFHEEDFKCEIEQIFKPEHENCLIFSIDLPYNMIVLLKEKEEEKQENNLYEFGNQLDKLYDEVDEFSSELSDVSDSIEDMEISREHVEKIKKLRADLEKIKLEFGEIL